MDVYNHQFNVQLSDFGCVTNEDVEKLIKGCATKSHVLDPIPTWFLEKSELLKIFICSCYFLIQFLFEHPFEGPQKIDIRSLCCSLAAFRLSWAALRRFGAALGPPLQRHAKTIKLPTL